MPLRNWVQIDWRQKMGLEYYQETGLVQISFKLAIDRRVLQMFDSPVFKILAHNDTGAAVGHQGGFVIPKDIEDFFPDVSGSITQENPTIDVSIRAKLFLEGKFLEEVQTRYQYQSWRGTRFERRLTGNLGTIRNIAVQGDIAIFSRDIYDGDHFRIELLKSGSARHSAIIANANGKRWGIIVGFSAPISNSEIKSAFDAISKYELDEFSIYDQSRSLIESRRSRKVRSSAFRQTLLKRYGLNCMVTGEVIHSVRGGANIDAAHIIPVGFGGSDDPRNGLLMNKDMHWAFDEGLFTVANSFELIVSEQALKKAANTPLRRLVGQHLRINSAGLQPHKDALSWHREFKFIG